MNPLSHRMVFSSRTSRDELGLDTAVAGLGVRVAGSGTLAVADWADARGDGFWGSQEAVAFTATAFKHIYSPFGCPFDWVGDHIGIDWEDAIGFRLEEADRAIGLYESERGIGRSVIRSSQQADDAFFWGEGGVFGLGFDGEGTMVSSLGVLDGQFPVMGGDIIGGIAHDYFFSIMGYVCQLEMGLCFQEWLWQERRCSRRSSKTGTTRSGLGEGHRVLFLVLQFTFGGDCLATGFKQALRLGLKTVVNSQPSWSLVRVSVWGPAAKTGWACGPKTAL